MKKLWLKENKKVKIKEKTVDGSSTSIFIKSLIRSVVEFIVVRSIVLLSEFVQIVANGVCGFIDGVDNATIDPFLMSKNERSNEFRVNFLGTQRGRQIKPQHKSALEKPINRKISFDLFRTEFNNVKQSENDPIRQPLRVIRFRRRFDCFYRNVRRIQKTD